MDRKRISLRVKKSRISQGGRTRICRSAFKNLSLSQGDKVVIYFKRNTIIVTGYSDSLVEEGFIYLRQNDLRRLGAREGEQVVLQTIAKTQISTLGFQGGKIV